MVRIRILHGNISHSFLRTGAVVITAVISIMAAGCEGDTGPQGPEGPQGPPGGGGAGDFVVGFVGTPGVPRADGSSTVDLTAHVSTPGGNNVVGIEVSFDVQSGAGSVSPSSVATDAAGNASCTYTTGTQSGIIEVSASITGGEYDLSSIVSVYVDPLTVSPPLLTSGSTKPMRGNWRSDGNRIYFDHDDWRDHSLYEVDAQGGTPQFFGGYRGGVWKTDGSNRMAVHDATSFYIVDDQGAVIEGPMRPTSFYGEPRAVGWGFDGDSLVVTSNTNAQLCYSSMDGVVSKCFGLPVWASTISPVSGTSEIVITGSGDFSGGIFRVDLLTRNATQLVAGGDFYTPGIDIKGASVNSAATTIVYAAREKLSNGYSENHDLYTVPVAGGIPQKILDSPVDEMFPQWSPDGSKILFCSDRPGVGYNLYVLFVN